MTGTFHHKFRQFEENSADVSTPLERETKSYIGRLSDELLRKSDEAFEAAEITKIPIAYAVLLLSVRDTTGVGTSRSELNERDDSVLRGHMSILKRNG